MSVFYEVNFHPPHSWTKDELIGWLKTFSLNAFVTEDPYWCPDLQQNLGGIQIYKRLTITEQNKNSIKKQLAQERFKNVLVSVHCTTPELTKWALSDNRVDLIGFDLTQIGKLFDRKAARMAHLHEKIVELNLHDLLYKANKITMFRQLLRATHWLKKKECQFIVTAGAQNGYELRNPYDLVALGTVFGLDYPQDLIVMNQVIADRIRRNIRRIKHMTEIGEWYFPHGVDTNA